MCRGKDEKNNLMGQKSHLDGLAVAVLLILLCQLGRAAGRD